MGRVGSGYAGCDCYDPNLTQPTIKRNFITQPNPTHPPTHPPIKTDPTQRVELGQVSFGKLVDQRHTSNKHVLSIIVFMYILLSSSKTLA